MVNWATPLFSRSEVNHAGKVFVRENSTSDKYAHALEIINNWRASHQYPLNTFQVTLRRKAKILSSDSLVSQRIKRLDSIHRKLSNTTIKLSQVQDTGGCRVVLDKPNDIQRLYSMYLEARFGHELKNERNYVTSPKNDGYRSVHLIYRYKGTDNTVAYSGHQIEIQIRSQLQHAWATAVEAVGTFTKQALKWRGGNTAWQRFFALMSSSMAIIEKCPLVENTPKSKRELAAELRVLSSTLKVQELLKAYTLTLTYVGNLNKSDAKLLLVHMKPNENNVEVRGFRLRESQQANEEYIKIEKSINPNSADQAVLVNVGSLHALQRAYPNYFLDTERFSQTLLHILKWR